MSGPAPSDLSGLVSLAHRRDLDLRPVILRVQTDLFVMAPARDRTAIEAFEALACGLLPTVDDETAAIVARKVAPLADTPERVLNDLAKRGGEALRAVLELAPHLSASILAAVPRSGSELARAMATRPGLCAAEIEELICLADEAVDLALASNKSIVLRGAALDALLARARTAAELAQALLAREDVSSMEATLLYLDADEPRRKQLLADVQAIAALRTRLLASVLPNQRAKLVAQAGAGDRAAFGEDLAAILALPSTPDWRFDEIPRHDLLVLALLTIGVSEEEGFRILLTLEPSIYLSVDSVMRLVRLFRATPRATAAYILEAVLGTPVGAKNAGQHRPHLEPSGTPSRTSSIGSAMERDGARQSPALSSSRVAGRATPR